MHLGHLLKSYWVKSLTRPLFRMIFVMVLSCVNLWTFYLQTPWRISTWLLSRISRWRTFIDLSRLPKCMESSSPNYFKRVICMRVVTFPKFWWLWRLWRGFTRLNSSSNCRCKVNQLWRDPPSAILHSWVWIVAALIRIISKGLKVNMDPLLDHVWTSKIQ